MLMPWLLPDVLEITFDAIDAIRIKRKRHNRDSVSDFICTRLGLGKDKADGVLDEMLLSWAIYVKKVRGKDSYFICKEAKAGIKSKVAKLCDPLPSKSVAHVAYNSTDPTHQ